ncbi:hypothetical protein F5146DRAFT_1192440 [Armillaria mellea]|nr:hypothetical protein F5146DRAFT_1192440 [Armillaria mellea]
MAQNKQNSSGLKEVATTIATSTSPGTAANTVALGVVLWCSITKILPRWSANSAIDSLAKAIDEVADVYRENRSILDDHGRSFERELRKLELAALDLKEKHIENSLNVAPWKNLPSWLSHRKYVWAMARTSHREVDMLKSSLDQSSRVPSKAIGEINIAIPLVIRGIIGNRKWVWLDVLRIGNQSTKDILVSLSLDSTDGGGCTNLMRPTERAERMLQDYREQTELLVNPERTIVRAIQVEGIHLALESFRAICRDGHYFSVIETKDGVQAECQAGVEAYTRHTTHKIRDGDEQWLSTNPQVPVIGKPGPATFEGTPHSGLTTLRNETKPGRNDKSSYYSGKKRLVVNVRWLQWLNGAVLTGCTVRVIC